MGENNYILNVDDINENIKIFDENEKYKEFVLKALFDKYKWNISYYEILIKVTTLNTLYSAGLNNSEGKKTIDVVTMARHILLEPNFDSWLTSDDEKDNYKAYDYIASGVSAIRDGHYNKCKAFASKYCHWHRPEVFPIMDSRAKSNLYNFIDINDISDAKVNGWDKIKKDDFSDYNLFWEVFKEFKKYINEKLIGEEKYSIKDIDKLLWQYGRPKEEKTTSKEEIEGRENQGEKSKDS